MARSIGIHTFTQAVHELWRGFDMPLEPKLEVECFHIANSEAIKARVCSPYFKTIEDYVDESWERNR